MCWHDSEEESRYRRESHERAAKQNKLPRTTTVSVLDAAGQFVGEMPVEWRSAQKVANTIRDLKAWHPNAVSADLVAVNELRTEYNYLKSRHQGKLARLDNGSLPEATGEAEPYAFAKSEATWDEELKEAALYIHAQNAKVARKGILARVFA